MIEDLGDVAEGFTDDSEIVLQVSVRLFKRDGRRTELDAVRREVDDEFTFDLRQESGEEGRFEIEIEGCFAVKVGVTSKVAAVQGQIEAEIG